MVFTAVVVINVCLLARFGGAAGEGWLVSLLPLLNAVHFYLFFGGGGGMDYKTLLLYTTTTTTPND